MTQLAMFVGEYPAEWPLRKVYSREEELVLRLCEEVATLRGRLEEVQQELEEYKYASAGMESDELATYLNELEDVAKLYHASLRAAS